MRRWSSNRARRLIEVSSIIDPHLKDIGFFETIDHPTEGKIINMKLPNKLSRGARTDFRHAPLIGQHSVEILREAGLADAAIQQLVASGAAVDGGKAKP